MPTDEEHIDRAAKAYYRRCRRSPGLPQQVNKGLSQVVHKLTGHESIVDLHNVNGRLACYAYDHDSDRLRWLY